MSSSSADHSPRSRSSNRVLDALVKSVANTSPSRQFPDQPGVDRAEADLPVGGAGASVVDGVEQPRHLGGGEHRIERQSGERPDDAVVAGSSELGTSWRAPSALPADDRAEQRSGGPLPANDRLALIADPDGDRRARGHFPQAVRRSRVEPSARSRRHRSGPSPAGELDADPDRCRRPNLTVGRDDHCFGVRRALVDRQHERFGHRRCAARERPAPRRGSPRR